MEVGKSNISLLFFLWLARVQVRAGLVQKKFYKIFQDFPSHRIFRHMHELLNIDKKIKLITQFSRNSRDESFKSN
jgi:hypothetical protein